MDVQKFSSALSLIRNPDVEAIMFQMIQSNIEAGLRETNIFDCLEKAGYEYDNIAGEWKKERNHGTK